MKSQNLPKLIISLIYYLILVINSIIFTYLADESLRSNNFTFIFFWLWLIGFPYLLAGFFIIIRKTPFHILKLIRYTSLAAAFFYFSIVLIKLIFTNINLGYFAVPADILINIIITFIHFLIFKYFKYIVKFIQSYINEPNRAN